MQQQKDTIKSTSWNDDADTTVGPTNLLDNIEAATNDWTNVNNQTYTLGTTVFSRNSYVTCRDDDYSVCDSNLFTLPERTAKACVASVQEVVDLGCSQTWKSCPMYLWNFLSGCTMYQTVCTEGSSDYYLLLNSIDTSDSSQTFAVDINYEGKLNSFTPSNKISARAVVVSK